MRTSMDEPHRTSTELQSTQEEEVAKLYKKPKKSIFDKFWQHQACTLSALTATSILSLFSIGLFIFVIYSLHRTIGNRCGNPLPYFVPVIGLVGITCALLGTAIHLFCAWKYKFSNLKVSILRANVTVFLWILGAFGVLLMIVTAFGTYYIRARTHIVTHGQIDIPATLLSEPVLVEREENGMIHIRAKNNQDMFVAQGFIAAQERLFQIELQRRIVRGTVSSLVGTPGIEIDTLSRTMKWFSSAQRALKNLTPKIRAILDAYCKGVNAYMEHAWAHKPLEFLLVGAGELQPILPEDVVGWYKVMAWEQGANGGNERLRYFLMQKGLSLEKAFEYRPFAPLNSTTILSALDLKLQLSVEDALAMRARQLNNSAAFIPNKVPSARLHMPTSPSHSMFGQLTDPIEDALHFGFSNNWVIGGQFTESKKPLLANDPHMRLNSPGLWLLMHLHSDEVDAIGGSFPGVPAIVIGRNEHIAWGFTNAVGDAQDHFVLTEKEPKKSYLHMGHEIPFEKRVEEIHIKGRESIKLNILDSEYGPVVNDLYKIPGNPISLSWVGNMEQDTSVEGFLKLMFARNWTEFSSAASLVFAPVLSVVYADADNNIGYISVGKVPIRHEGHSGLVPVKGNGHYDYVGYVEFKDQPQVYNPPEGFIITANNLVTPPGYPYIWSYDAADDHRATRIVQMLQEKLASGKPLTKQDMVAMQTDVKSLFYARARPTLQKMSFTDATVQQWLTKLLNWDGNESNESIEATLFEAWYRQTARFAISEVGSAWYNAMYVLNLIKTPKGFEFAQQAFADVVKTKFNGNIPTWGSVHKTLLNHLILANTPLGCYANRVHTKPGGTETVNVANSNANFESVAGAAYRQVVSLDGKMDDLFIAATGQSENWLSHLYDNYGEMWANNQYATMSTSGYKIKSHVTLVSKKQ